jgi:hypothetical protein
LLVGKGFALFDIVYESFSGAGSIFVSVMFLLFSKGEARARWLEAPALHFSAACWSPMQ